MQEPVAVFGRALVRWGNWRALPIATVWLLTAHAALGGWAQYQVGSFRVYSEFPLKETGTLVGDLQRLPDDLSRSLQLPLPETVVEVFLFSDRNAYEQYLKTTMPNAPQQRRALFVHRADSYRVYAYRNRHLATDVRHECTHALLHSSLAMVPLWLDEGLATYFQVEPGRRFADNPALRGLVWDMRLGRMTTFEALENLTSVEAMAATDYRTAWAWVHFMFHGPPEAREELVGFLADIRMRRPPGSLRARLQRRLPGLAGLMADHHKGR